MIRLYFQQFDSLKPTSSRFYIQKVLFPKYLQHSTIKNDETTPEKMIKSL